MIKTAMERQTRRRRMRRWIIFGSATIAISCWWWLREPRYKGLSLSNWLDTYDAILTGHLTQPGFEETRAALLHFGQHGLSYYTARLAYETPTWQLSVLNYLDTAQTRMDKLQKKLSELGHDYVETRNKRAAAAALAFELLGTNGSVAVPGLERIAFSYDYPTRTQRAMIALHYVGPSGRAALRRIAMTGPPGPSAEALQILSPTGTSSAWNQGWPAYPNLRLTSGINRSNRSNNIFLSRP